MSLGRIRRDTFLVLKRTLARRNSSSLSSILFKPVAPIQNISPMKIIEELREDKKTQHTQIIQQARVFLFYRLLESGELTRAKVVLMKIDHDFPGYIHLLEDYSKKVLEKTSPRISELLNIYALLTEANGGELPPKITANYVSLLLSQGRTSQIKKSEYLVKFFKKHDIDIQSLELYLTDVECEMLRRLVKHSSSLTPPDEQRKVKEQHSTKGTRTNIKSQVELKDDNSILSDVENPDVKLEDVCGYIESNPFKFKGRRNEKNLPLYEFYDTLSPEERTQFEKEYTAHNIPREMTLEMKAEQMFITSYLAKLDNEFHKSSKILNSNRLLLYQWTQDLTQHIELLAKKYGGFNAKYIRSPMTQPSTEKYSPEDNQFLRYSFIFDTIPHKILAATIITKVSISVLTQDSGHEMSRKVCSSVGHAIHNLTIKHYNDWAKKNNKLVLKSILLNNEIMRVGSLFLTLMLEVTKLPTASGELQPAFKHELTMIPHVKDNIGVIKAHEGLVDSLGSALETFKSTNYLPMLVKPKSWVSPNEGGYLTDCAPILLSTKNSEEQILYLKKAHKLNNLENLYTALDVLGTTAWCINSKTLEVLTHYFENGKPILKLPADYDEHFLEKIEPPSSEMTRQEYAIFQDTVAEKKKDYYGSVSRRLFMDDTISLASAYAQNGEMIYLPHAIDFRGRAYPLPTSLRHNSADPIRALFMFWHSKPLGDGGLDWLKAHLASVYGNDKLSKSDKIKFIDKNLHYVFDSADNPINGLKWWQSADKPWQTLSVCFEVAAAIRSGNPKSFLSRMPVHQDGSCNGLQHYAALGADMEGARQVNLVPSKTKMDVYSSILKIVESKLKDDCEDSGSKYHHLAKAFQPFLSRTTVKQTVMTSVYGVTQYGAIKQMDTRIKEALEREREKKANNEPTLVGDGQLDWLSDRANSSRVAHYLGVLTLNAIKSLFFGARNIQDWLLTNTARITKSINETILKEVPTLACGSDAYTPMSWTSLSGIPVVQLYREESFVRIPTSISTFRMVNPLKFTKVLSKKQTNSVAPNFIHSIDGTHLVMTAISCHANNIKFASVHDSFWTHACDVDSMSYSLREQFVSLHSMDIIGGLREDLLARTKNSVQVVHVRTNSDAGREILQLREQQKERRAKISTINDQLKREIFVEIQKSKGASSERTPNDIIQEHAEDVYFATSSSKYIKYDESIGSESKKFSFKRGELIQVAVPVKILECPPLGTLDITSVRDSEYFFS